MENALYLVATPIGNLNDISKRAIEVLKSVDLIACEDTRTSQKLFNHFEITNKTVPFHKHNTAKMTDEILDRITDGNSVALISDAGMPCISDPGQHLVNEANKRDIQVYVIPGPSALVCAFAASGFEYKKFSFFGFLENENTKRKEELEMIKNSNLPIILYIAPHKMISTLKELQDKIDDRKIFIIKEITKIHEKSMITMAKEAIDFYEKNQPKGEYVMVIEPKKEFVNYDFDKLSELTKDIKNTGIPLSVACKIVSKHFGVKKNKLYDELKDD